MKRDKNKAMSWSQLSTFDNPDYPKYSDPEKWYKRYILKEEEPTKAVFEFGSKIDTLIQTDSTFLPELPRYPKMQYKLEGVYKKIKLVGYADGIDFENNILVDYKTGKQAWDKKRTDQTTQLTMYVTLLYISKKINPKKIQCKIYWLETYEKGDFTIDFVKDMQVKTFETKRTMADVLKCLGWIERTVKAMDKYVANHD